MVTWKNIRLGLCHSGAEYVERIRAAGCSLCEASAYMLERIDVSLQNVGIDLVKVTGSELGLAGKVSFEQVLAAAQCRGLRVCPEEAGPALRLQYLGQPIGEAFKIAMTPIGRAGYFHVFALCNHDIDNAQLALVALATGPIGGRNDLPILSDVSTSWLFCTPV